MLVKETKKERTSQNDGIEIRLTDVVKFLRTNVWMFIRWAVVFFVIGILYAFSQKNEYTAVVKIMPELKTSSGSGGLGDLKSLASLAGVNINNLGGSSDAIRPDLYPDILKSIPFCLYLLNQPVTTSETSKPLTLQKYFTDQDKGILSNILESIFSSTDKKDVKTKPSVTTVPTLQLTKEQDALSKLITTRVNADMDKKSGIITIVSRMPDPIVAASAARQTLDYLTTYVTNYRTGKARKQLQFLNEQVGVARRRYEASELGLSNFRDRNRNLFLNTARIEEQRLQADYLLAQGVYSDLLKQLEQAKIKVEEESPVFQVLEPAQIPLHKSGPKRLIIIAVFTLFGIVVGLAISIVRLFIAK